MKSNNLIRSKKSSKRAESFFNSETGSWAIAAILALSTAAAFLPALWNEFVNWDDYETLVDNARYRGLGWAQVRWMFTTFHMGHYQPLSWITFALDYLIWGSDPFGYHLTNLILHATNAVLFYLLCRFLLSRVFSLARDGQPQGLSLAAGLAAFLFAVHPLRVESVAWATERRDVLSAGFFLSSIYSYLRAHVDLRGPSRGWLGAAVIAHALSLFSKGTAMTLPAVLLLLDIYPLGRLPGKVSAWVKPNYRYILWEKAPFLVLALAFALIAVLAQQNTGALRPVQEYFVSYRVAQSFYGVCFYLWKSLLPIRLSPLYELPFDYDAWLALFLVCGAAAVTISVTLYLLRRRWPGLLACWVYYVVVLAPVSGVAQSGPQLAADRYSYLSCLSWAVLLGGGFFQFWRSVGQSPERRPALVAILALAVLVVILLGAATWKQTGVWRDTQTLWQHVITVAPRSSIAHYNLGKLSENDGRLEEGLESYRRAVNINPANAEAHYNLARLLAKQGMQAEAIAHYRQAAMIRPGDADTHNNLGLLLALQGEVEASLEEFQRAVQIDPNHVRAFYNMGRVFSRQGELEKGVQNFRQALKLNPDEVEILFGLGDALARQKRWEEAVVHLEKAVKLKPASPEARVALARSLAAQGKKNEAEKHYQEALRLLKAQSQMPLSNSGKSH